MLKKFLILCSIFLFSLVNNVFAHTHIESSSPQSGEALNEELKEITLTFEGKIEQSSTFTLKNAAGEAIPVDNITVAGAVLTGSLSTPLENGEYLINWDIIGADGHLIEGEVPFTVDVSKVATDDNTDEGTVDAEVTDAELVIDAEELEPDVEQNLTGNEPAENSSSYLFPSLIGVLILIVIGSFLFIAKRKQ